jgi:uncharacterized tellurite resistance protein B-like protein
VLKSIQNFFNTHLASNADADLEHRLRLASAALMIEVMGVDEEEHHAEHQALIQALQSKFSLSASETSELMSLARQESADATDYHQFTNLITNEFSPEQRTQLLQHLWQIAYADGELDKYEEHLIRKIADLLYLSQETFIKTKLNAQNLSGR